MGAPEAVGDVVSVVTRELSLLSNVESADCTSAFILVGFEVTTKSQRMGFACPDEFSLSLQLYCEGEDAGER